MRDRALEILRDALVRGRFSPGEPLSEPALANELDISRGPVREALLVLVQEGLVTHSQNYGFSVALFTEADRREVLTVRCPLETLALELGRERVSGADLAELEAMAREVVRHYCLEENFESAQADWRFHQKIWALSGNSQLERSLRHLLMPYFAYGSVFRISRNDLTPELLEDQHRSYLDYLAGKSNQPAAACVRYHLGL
jgi:DNA-binding GntR family transcriptional regulator